MRGEQIATLPAVIASGGSPPRARGAVDLLNLTERLRRITPACAGSSHAHGAGACHDMDHPRVRGEQLTKAREKDRRQGSPPRARGAERCQDALGVQDGITPACAGSSSTNKSSNPWKRDHLRVRGEQQPLHLLRVLQEGSPPRARGAEVVDHRLQVRGGITPACAGSRVHRVYFLNHDSTAPSTTRLWLSAPMM